MKIKATKTTKLAGGYEKKAIWFDKAEIVPYDVLRAAGRITTPKFEDEVRAIYHAVMSSRMAEFKLQQINAAKQTEVHNNDKQQPNTSLF